MSKPPGLVIVGELNPYGANHEFALYHLPRKASGNRLREHLGLSDAAYEALDKVNLCEGEWSIKDAREVAEKISMWSDVVVMLGAKVKHAFWTSFRNDVPPPIFPFEAMLWLSCRYVYLPHPSGLNRAWNDPSARTRARELMSAVAPWVPWGQEKIVDKSPRPRLGCIS